MKRIKYHKLFPLMMLIAVSIISNTVLAKEKVKDNLPPSYRINEGDILNVSVWNEPDLQVTVVVRPDGKISFPLAGEIIAGGKTFKALTEQISHKLKSYIPDLVVTVSAKKLQGNKIYVIGKVARPGELIISGSVDVVQALSMAGGGTKFSQLGKIKILRRTGAQLHSIAFDYTDIEKGRNLKQDIILKTGDVIIVP